MSPIHNRYGELCNECDYWSILVNEDDEVVGVIIVAKGYVEDDAIDC